MDRPAELAERFASLTESAWRPSSGELEALHRRACVAAGVDIDAATFVAGLAANADLDGPPGDDGLVEIALVAALGAGSQEAEVVVAERYLSAADEALAHMRLPGAVAEDVRQAILEKLLIADGDAPSKLATYAGLGKLRGLVKVASVRAALSELRKRKREVAMPEAGPDVFEADGGEAGADPELAFVKKRYRAEFKVAFEEAVGDLTERERNLLRLHLLRGVTLASLADIYGVHRATVTRWLAAARERVMKQTRAHLGARLELGRSEIDSVMAWIGSRLDASVSRVLRTRTTPPAP